MNAEGALRKIGLLQRITAEHGAYLGEAEAAARLVLLLRERYEVKEDEIRPIAPPSSPMTWAYWQQLGDEFDLKLSRFGGRASVELRDDARLIIRLDGGCWHIEGRSPQGWHQIARGSGLEAARNYLTKLVPRRYTFLNS